MKYYEESSRNLTIDRFFLRRIIPFCKSPILDIGCGVGIFLGMLYLKGFTMVGLDNDKEKVETARKDYPEIKFRTSSFQDFQPDYPFETIIAKNIFEHLTPEKTAFLLEKMGCWLSDSGKIIVYVPNSMSLFKRIGYHMGLNQYYHEPTVEDAEAGHIRSYTTQLLELELNRANFRIVELKGLILTVLPYAVMKVLNPQLLEALYELGKDARIAHLCSGFYAIGKKRRS